MVAVGCLIPFVLTIAGAVAGGVVNGGHDAVFGGVIGAIIGAIAMIALLWGFERIRNRGI